MLGWFFKVFFFLLFISLRDKIFADERRKEVTVHEVTRLISAVPHRHARIRLFFFEPSCWVTVFLFLFFLVYSTVYATSLITNLLRTATFTHFR